MVRQSVGRPEGRTRSGASATQPNRAFNFAELPNGRLPYGGVIGDAHGNLFGTAASGGRYNSGLVYKVDSAGKGTILFNFAGGSDGSGPQAGVILDSAGNLYGTTEFGGTGKAGVVYKLDPAGHQTVLYSFTGGADGKYPMSGVMRDSAGNLYGTTAYGGSAAQAGVVYKIDTTGQETVLYTFTGGADGSRPFAGVTLDAAGNLYGTTAYGGTSLPRCAHPPTGCGVVFKVDPSGHETVLHTFTAGPDGAEPYSSVVFDEAGNLYGTTWSGGTGCGSTGCGVVYKLDPAGHETVLYSFDGAGESPYGAVTLDAAGNVYGTTEYGGIGNCNGGYPCGVVYKLDATGHQTVLHRFTGGTDGGTPAAGVIRDAFGNLYGTTLYGGPANLGAVFKLDATGQETVLDVFTGGDSGYSPQSGVIRDSAGSLYGAAYYGGTANTGVLYQMDATAHETVLYNFQGNSGIYPSGNIVRDAAGNTYGTAISANGCCGAEVYKVDATGHETVLASFDANDQLVPGVVRDAAGNLYVTVNGGAAGGGAVYKVPPSGPPTALYTFTGGDDGGSPFANVTVDAAGNLYGTTSQGGTAGRGTVFKLSPSGEETVLYNFTFTAGVDGGAPYAGVTLDSAGNIYGTTGWGGTASAGTVFKLSPAGQETILYSFTQNWPSGPTPYSSLVLDSAGHLYGTTLYGGGGYGCGGYGCGTVYEVDSSGNYTLLHGFTGGADGATPVTPVLLDGAGHLFGTASGGGKRLGGVLFKLTL